MQDEVIAPAQAETEVSNDTSTENVEQVSTESVAEETPTPAVKRTPVEIETPDDPYKEVSQVEETQTEEVPKEAVESQEETRIKKAIKSVETSNQRLAEVVNLQADLVAETPELIHKIQEKNPDLANRIIQKVWGETAGVKTYKDLLERAKLEQLRESNPELYETKRELAEIRARLTEKEQREAKLAEEKFLKARGVIVNDYDPNYKKVKEALQLVNPTLVKDDYSKALELAYGIAFAKTPPSKTVPLQAKPAASGSNPPVLPEQSEFQSSQSDWLYQGLMKVGRYDTKKK